MSLGTSEGASNGPREDRPASGDSQVTPWSLMQHTEALRFGPEIFDADARRRWCGAIMFGGLRYLWRHSAHQVRARAVEALRPHPGQRILVIGEALDDTGALDELAPLVGIDGEVVAIDFLEEVRDLMLAGRQSQREWRYTRRWPPDSFDGVLVIQGISHAGDWNREGRELARVLRPGGAMVLAEIGFTDDFYRRAHADMHLEYFVRKLFEGAGLAWRSLPSWEPAKVMAALSGVLRDVKHLEDHGAQLFWGVKAAEVRAVGL